MKKIISLFKRNYDGDHMVRDEVVEGAEWVLEGEGIATRKWDGTCCLIRDGRLYKRFDAKAGKKPPEGFIPAQDPDPITGHYPGWLEVSRDNPGDKWHIEAFEKTILASGKTELEDGTYELCGPKINGNNETLLEHELIPHGEYKLAGVPRDFKGVKEYLKYREIEGIVWHHPDGRMVKIKRRDFWKVTK